MQVIAAVLRNPGEQNVVMTALNEIDRVDLYVPQMTDCCRGRGRPVTERCRGIEHLGVQPDLPGAGLSDCDWVHGRHFAIFGSPPLLRPARARPACPESTIHGGPLFYGQQIRLWQSPHCAFPATTAIELPLRVSSGRIDYFASWRVRRAELP